MKTNFSIFTIVLAVSIYNNSKIYPPENNHCITIEYNTNPYTILIPKFLLLTIAVKQKATKPSVIPLVTRTRKLNQIKAFDQNLKSRIRPLIQYDILMIITLTEYVIIYVK